MSASFNIITFKSQTWAFSFLKEKSAKYQCFDMSCNQHILFNLTDWIGRRVSTFPEQHDRCSVPVTGVTFVAHPQFGLVWAGNLDS